MMVMCNTILGVEDFKHHVTNHTLCQTESLFHEEPLLVCPLFQSTADTILTALGKRTPYSIYRSSEESQQSFGSDDIIIITE